MDIKDKIAKLLALADSPNENEAKLALLRARELMAQHKLRPEECVKTPNMTVVKKTCMVEVSKTKYKFAVTLSQTIADYYCCRSYYTKMQGSRMHKIGFVGFEEDWQICSKIYEYAFDCIRSGYEDVIKRNMHRDGVTRRDLAESYAYGYARGIREALKKQNDEHQEYALVMVTPNEVLETMKKGFKSEAYNTRFNLNQTYQNKGYEEGLNFNPYNKIDKSRINHLQLN